MLYINGVIYPETGNSPIVNGVEIKNIIANGVLVWTKKAPAGSQTFTASGTFIVPEGYTEVSICMCGGGGSGAQLNEVSTGGGHAGQIISQTVVVTPGESISVVIGAGAPSGPQTGNYNGTAGGNSSFKGVTALGGVGGVSGHYMGNGASRITCGGTFSDGVKATYGSWTGGGGEAGAFGNGGRGGNNTVASQAGGIGAGGGASTNSSPAGYSHAGGRGQCVVSWG